MMGVDTLDGCAILLMLKTLQRNLGMVVVNTFGRYGSLPGHTTNLLENLFHNLLSSPLIVEKYFCLFVFRVSMCRN